MVWSSSFTPLPVDSLITTGCNLTRSWGLFPPSGVQGKFPEPIVLSSASAVGRGFFCPWSAQSVPYSFYGAHTVFFWVLWGRPEGQWLWCCLLLERRMLIEPGLQIKAESFLRAAVTAGQSKQTFRLDTSLSILLSSYQKLLFLSAELVWSTCRGLTVISLGVFWFASYLKLQWIQSIDKNTSV